MRKAIKFLQFTPQTPHKFASLPCQSGIDKSFVTLIIAGITTTIPSCYASLVKNFGLSYLLGVPLIGAVTGLVVYTMPGSASQQELTNQLSELVTELDRIYSQLNLFIAQFHNFVNVSHINVVTDAQGQLSIDVLNTIDDETSQQYANRIIVFDRLVRNHMELAETLLDRMSDIESEISNLDSNYVSRLQNYIDTLEEIIRNYGH